MRGSRHFVVNLQSALSYLIILGSYTALALVLTWPLVTHFTSHVPGDGGDDPALYWNLWWVKHALLDRARNPFACDAMFYPIGINLAFYTLTVLNGVLSIPLQLVLGLIPTSNIILLSSFVLGAYGTYLLVLWLVGERELRCETRGAAFIAGLIYAFSSSKLFYAALGQFNIASSQWVPFYVLYLLKATRVKTQIQQPDFHRLSRASSRYTFLAALFLVFQAWAEMSYASFLVVFTVVYGLWGVGRALTRPSSARWVPGLIGQLALLGGLFFIGISPILAQMWPDLQAEGDFMVEGSGFAEWFSADLIGFFIPTQLHPLFGPLVKTLPFPHDKGQHLYPGYLVLALAVFCLIKGRRQPIVQFWTLSAAFFFLLTLGPNLRILGHETGLPLPFRLLQGLPFFKGNRYPSRYSVLLTLSLAVLSGHSLSQLLKSRPRPVRVSRFTPFISPLLAIFILLEHLSIPLPLSDLRPPELYDVIAQDQGAGTVLELPRPGRCRRSTRPHPLCPNPPLPGLHRPGPSR